MVHNTTKLGPPSSNVVVAKVGVSLCILPQSSPYTHIPCSSLAWAYDDDHEADTRPGRGGFCGDQGRHRFSASRRKDVSQQRYLGFHSMTSILLNSHVLAEFYGPGLTVANLELLARFFEKYPEYADRTFLSVKGGLLPHQWVVNGSKENLRRSVDEILKALRGTKWLDLFVPGRRDSNYETEQYAEVLNELVKEGKFDYIGLSEVSAETVRRAHKVRSLLSSPNPIQRVQVLIVRIRLCLSLRSRSK